MFKVKCSLNILKTKHDFSHQGGFLLCFNIHFLCFNIFPTRVVLSKGDDARTQQARRAGIKPNLSNPNNIYDLDFILCAVVESQLPLT